MSQVSKYLAKIGAKGGKAKGESKRRGDADYYKMISRKAAEARKAKALRVSLEQTGQESA